MRAKSLIRKAKKKMKMKLFLLVFFENQEKTIIRVHNRNLYEVRDKIKNEKKGFVTKCMLHM